MKKIPGILYCLVLALISYLLAYFVPLVSSLLFAILLGVLVRNTHLIARATEPGIKFTSKTILRTGVVLLGLRLSVPQVLALGPGALVVIVLTVALTYTCVVLLGRALRVPHTTAVLIATGSSICGAAAVAAMSSVVRPLEGKDGQKDDERESAAATAVATVTLFGTLSLLAIPSLAALLGWGQTPSAIWIGSSIHEVGQVTAAAQVGAGRFGAEGGAQVLSDATVTKLGRVVLLAPLVALIGFLEGRRTWRARAKAHAHQQVQRYLSVEEEDHTPVRGTTPFIPLFVVGFLAMVVARSLVADALPAEFYNVANQVTTFLLTMAMGAMGAAVNLRQLAKTGMRALLLGLLATIIVAAVSGTAIYFLI